MSTKPIASFTLQELHLYNWGAFAGRHQVSIDPENTAIIGPTGSGKTTLIDALMTLLCANPRYNLASTGGHESDRDLISYVRGHSGHGHSGDSSDHIARAGRCVTGLAAKLVRNSGECVLLGGLFWFDGSSSATGDMLRRWFFYEGTEHNLDLWLDEHDTGGARALGKLEKNTEGLRMFSSKSTYLAKLQSYFEVGANAFTLLNRAAGLKQLNSIDEIFRELVLDDHSAFEEAQEVAKSFDQLAGIHDDLELANRQYLSLIPLRKLAGDEQTQAQKLHHLRELNEEFPHWIAEQGESLWNARHETLQTELNAMDLKAEDLQRQQDGARSQERTLYEVYLGVGGGNIELLKGSVKSAKALLVQRQTDFEAYQRIARNLQLDVSKTFSATVLAAHQQHAVQALLDLDEQKLALQAQFENAVTQERNAFALVQELRKEIDAVRQSPGSNLPSEFQHFRADLAEHLKLAAHELPYAAELIEVDKQHSGWRGAIERAIGSHRLRILVPTHAMREALAWVNQRHNRLHVRLLDVGVQTPAVTFWDDGFCRKLNFKPHTHLNALRALLAQLDRHCVDSVEDLQSIAHAMTQQGLMSGSARQFDKQDQRRITEGWLTGFDNSDRLRDLEQQSANASGDWHQLKKQKEEAQEAHSHAASIRVLWQQLQEVRFESLDIADASRQLDTLETQLQSMLDPNSDTGQAKQRWEAALKISEALGNDIRAHSLAMGQVQTRFDHARKTRNDYQVQLDELDAARERPVVFPHRLSEVLPQVDIALDCERLNDHERKLRTALHTQIDTHTKGLHQLHSDIEKQMGKALAADTGALVEYAQEIEAISHFLQRLKVLEEEALPEKRMRFQEYLNSTSAQGVTRLLSGIDTQVAEITNRIAELNQTLQRVDFQPGRYLQLAPQPVVHQSLQHMNQAMALLRTERLRDDGGQSHYKALRGMVELLREHATSRKTKPAQALLDARYRLQFAVQVIDRATGDVLERRTGSQGGSGGEKEIIASYVLTASLSYALCPAGRNRPVFGTIVLDEAFSKSSQAVAARIIQALREFGLHALFVTPNKELRLLRNHTRSAVVVHRVGKRATLASLSWTELDAHARSRQSAQAQAQAQALVQAQSLDLEAPNVE